jgi:hypothetical protein
VYKERWPDFFRLAKKLRPMIVDFAKPGKVKDDDGYTIAETENIIEDWVWLDSANLVTSETPMGTHRVVLDIDMDAALIPSTTPGHHHLIIDKAMEWETYKELLRALAKAGIIEKGFADVSIAKKYSAIRTPWTKKEDRDDAA